MWNIFRGWSGSRITIIKKRIYWTTYGRTFFRTYFEYNYP